MNFLSRARETRLTESPLSLPLGKLFWQSLTVLTLSFIGAPLFAQTAYYVAADGNDSNDGRSVTSPFKSLTKVNSLNLGPGDQVYFRRGDTFRGTLTVRQSGSTSQPIVVDAYGNGDKPVLAGSTLITGWSNLGGGVWQASCPSCGNQVTGLYRNGTPQPLGRYPNFSDSNKGYFTVQSNQGNGQLTSAQALNVNLNTGWSGTEVVIRTSQWITDRYNFVSQSGNSLNLSGAPSGYAVSPNWGFFVQNHPATLDQTGEWAFDTNTRTFRLYLPSGDPNTQTLTATVQQRVINFNGVSNLTIRNLRIAESLNTGLYVNNGNNLTFSGVEVLNSGENGIWITGSGSSILIEKSQVYKANNNGINIDYYQNVTLRGNTIRTIGTTPGRGKSADGQYNGVSSLVSTNMLMEDNTVDSIGYNAISFTTNTTIRRNVISNFCLTKCDGGGIYTWNGNLSRNGQTRIESNIVYNSMGAPEGTPGGAYSGANGIYLDDCTVNAQLIGNTVFNCHGFGVYLHATNGATLTNNTIYNNHEAQLAQMPAGGCAARNNNIQNNILVSRLANQLVGKYESNTNDIAQYGIWDYNYYARPLEDIQKIRVVFKDVNYKGGHYSLEQWQSMYGKDANSKDSPLTYAATESPDAVIKFLFNPTNQSQTHPLSDTYRDVKDQYYSGSITLAPFTSLVLLKDKPTTPVTLRDPENPANTVNGLDYSYYEGSWGNLPNFGTLTPVKTGVAGVADLSVRNLDDNFGLRFTGYVNVPADGVYTFYTNSDDGSKLFIGSTEVVNNDGGHPIQERSGNIGLKAGKHAITVTYFEGGGGQDLSISFKGPNMSKQTIPASALFRVGISSPTTSTTTVAPSTPFSPSTPTSPSTPALRDPENPSNASNGLDFSYYEGSWGTLPNFGSLSPVKTGVANVVDVSARGRDDNFGLRFTGYVNVPADGVYTFFTNSDDGSKLFIGSTEVVNNDGGHPVQERSGTIGLKAGKHAITVIYFEGAGGQDLSISFSGPGVTKQTLPASALFRVATTSTQTVATNTGTGTGLRGEYFNNVSLTTPSALSRLDANINFDWGAGSPASSIVNDYFSARWTGQVEAPVTGTYYFTTLSDDGVRLWVNGVQLINNWTGHALTTDNAAGINLVAGQKYTIRLEYFENIVGAAIQLRWAYPGQSQQLVPQNRLYPATGTARVARPISETNLNVESSLVAYPIPARDNLNIRYTAATEGTVIVQVVNVASQVALATEQAVQSGENTFSLSVGQLNRGMYILTLTQDGRRVTKKIILSE